MWYDASYWADGALPRLFLTRELSVVRRWVNFYLDLLFTSQAALLVGFVVLCFMAGPSTWLQQISAQWPIWLMGLAGLGMYALVHVELRYIAVFFTLIWVGLFSGLAMPPGNDGRRLVLLVVARGGHCDGCPGMRVNCRPFDPRCQRAAPQSVAGGGGPAKSGDYAGRPSGADWWEIRR